MSAELAEPLRAAIVGNAGIAALLPPYKGSEAVFTRKPLPEDVVYPVVEISPDTDVQNEDGINDFRPIATREITVWSSNANANTYRLASQIAYLIRNLLHRNRNAITVTGWHVIDLQVTGPSVALADSQSQVEGRTLTVQVRLAQLR